ncbi:MAG: type II toxin-antitoxin system RelB/DinJ family antitoxin [Oscillospiraceae bacterium]|nr:type II toxin-antitoxin system RelB/DinJ family antitoxin [Oscillospiraceae bacterium]
MSQVSINIRMDEELKKAMERTCQALGMNMTTAFTIFAKKMSREQRIPFEVSVEPAYNDILKAERNAEYLAMLDTSMQELADGKFVVKSIEELERLTDG